jgi:trimethylamine corrinoid protein
MPDHERLLQRMQTCIIDADEEGAVEAVKEALAAGIPPLTALEEGFAKAIRAQGEAFHQMEIFLPELVLSARAMQAGMTVLEPALKAEGIQAERKAVIVIGTVEGDIHDIGKNIVVAMLRAAGFTVHDLGTDVPLPNFISVAEQVHADVIAMSALLSTTMLRQRDLIEMLRLKGLREKYFVLVGGAPVTEAWVAEIGADACGKDAHQAVEVLEARLSLKEGG